MELFSFEVIYKRLCSCKNDSLFLCFARTKQCCKTFKRNLVRLSVKSKISFRRNMEHSYQTIDRFKLRVIFPVFEIYDSTF